MRVWRSPVVSCVAFKNPTFAQRTIAISIITTMYQSIPSNSIQSFSVTENELQAVRLFL